MKVHAFAATQQGSKLEPFEYELGPLEPDEVDIDIEYCGICHSDLHMLKNEWGITNYPFVPGHEIIGKVSEVGKMVTHLKTGQRVGVGWRSRSCQTCEQCLSGYHNRCLSGEDVIVGRHGGFGNKVRCQALWAFPLPDKLDIKTAGPLFCGGITVFNPIIQNRIKATDHVGVVGIGGLGHMALLFLKAWGCEVTAFSTNPKKEKEARKLGAHHFINSNNLDNLISLTDRFNLIIVTANVEIDWDAYINTLAPGGRLHIVGAVPQVRVTMSPLISHERSIGASPTGGPGVILSMLGFCARHQINPLVEEYPLSKVNEAFEHLEAGKARYRIILRNDLT
jgi:alcohol/geraniol dehydrogenase (NADP+)